MKKILSIVCLFVFCTNIFAQKSVFLNQEYDFSTLKEEKGQVNGEIQFINKTKTAFVVSAKSTVKNLRVLYSRDILNKKDTGRINITFNPQGIAGDFKYIVDVIINEKGKEYPYQVTVKGFVEPRPRSLAEIYKMKEGNLRYETNSKMFALTPNSLITDTFRFYNEWDQKMTFSVKELPSSIKVLYVTPELMPQGEGILVFEYNAKVKNDWGAVWDRLTLYTNDPDRGKKNFYISGNIYDDFNSWTPQQKSNAPKLSVSEEEYRFSPVTEGEDVVHTFVITNTGKSTLYLRKLRQSCSCTIVQPDKNELQPGESTNIKATFRTYNKSGHQMRTIDVISNDPERPKITLKIVGQINPKQN